MNKKVSEHQQRFMDMMMSDARIRILARYPYIPRDYFTDLHEIMLKQWQERIAKSMLEQEV